MIKHVVMWKVKDRDDIPSLRECLESMKGTVPTLIDLETGGDVVRGDKSWDLVLISTHRDREALDAYQDDPIHGEVKKTVGALVTDRASVDFEV
jgi:hypothetical protein